MLVLAFDTATPAVTAALHDGDRVLAESTTIDARRHGELLVPSIREVLREAGAALGDVTAIVAGAGPGPYTGLRVGLMTAQALAATAGAPAYGVCTLDALAYAAGLSEPFVVATDARRKEVFWAEYADARTRVTEPAVDHPGDLPAGPPLVGAGARMYAAIVGEHRLAPDAPEYPSAGALAALAAERLAATGGADGDAVLTSPRPIYLRRPDAREPGPPKKVTA
ncbi:tRNA (adenosine(37)-N6)-threonylcarbamoyltransferase complex dimerization subunit type 1 TsaB [Sphaerisporangium krabiense]|uniref:tRNA threonylcarbamoyl adenosine modification protein YeaZ n=1 Tax=Sphaerisporangium krabiense TaxID=763782 RepID=A0A7W8Z0G2_9ACTN|nr:tRNA (adenosine(37)-N6)-threonylcarbamoyltransferase complex dimerization subunit type 1 TsaB [Sphaerisporangium krabiense]MBB5624883.1 tRNA threonylcarbamoyl adenosine modification protein YeaZ [Sphaerisporangium krabiense]GII66415.1 tRNA (adenosine(37)-N6)-threonylcarbamoyltransferase complex dimerization subunit type 1 TsaB [Sphaerisporangium krabiense]